MYTSLSVVFIMLVLIITDNKKVREDSSQFRVVEDVYKNDSGISGEGNVNQESDYNDPGLMDPNFIEEKKNFDQNYPWYGHLPIDNQDYVVVWDWQELKFRISIKNSGTLTETEKNSIIERGVNDIKRITGEGFQNYSYYILYR